VAELRLAGVEDREGAKAFLPGYLAKHDRRFGVAAAKPGPAWRRMPGGTPIERVCRFKYRRTIARDGTVRVGATILQVPPRPNGRSRAGQAVELHVRLDGRMVIWDGEHELLVTPAPLGAVQLRALAHARVEVGPKPPSAATATAPPSPAHPWRRVAPGTKLATTIKAEREGRTESLSSQRTDPLICDRAIERPLGTAMNSGFGLVVAAMAQAARTVRAGYWKSSQSTTGPLRMKPRSSPPLNGSSSTPGSSRLDIAPRR
jgi:hypothetical protein